LLESFGGDCCAGSAAIERQPGLVCQQWHCEVQRSYSYSRSASRSCWQTLTYVCWIFLKRSNWSEVLGTSEAMWLSMSPILRSPRSSNVVRRSAVALGIGRLRRKPTTPEGKGLCLWCQSSNFASWASTSASSACRLSSQLICSAGVPW